MGQSFEITDPEALGVFAMTLLDASDKLNAISTQIAGSEVSGEAFGHLLEAQDVARAYAQRLPNTEDNLKSAAEAAEELAINLTKAQQSYQETEQGNTTTIQSSGQGL